LIISGSSCSKDFVISDKAIDESRPSVTGVKTLGNLHMHPTCSDALDFAIENNIPHGYFTHFASII